MPISHSYSSSASRAAPRFEGCRKPRRSTLAVLTSGLALSAATLVGSAYAGPRSEPFDAWAEPVIQSKMTVEEAKALVAERTKPQTEWKGPT
ncbi:MAG TPA: hypothetical protein VHA35_06115, partial [Dongiaceae bacterium]|nr:hypothetical protein [Dongiaceae bacterium]